MLSGSTGLFRTDRFLWFLPFLTELLSDPGVASKVSKIVFKLLLRGSAWILGTGGCVSRKVLSKQRTARLGDAFIAQSCIDTGIPLLTRNRDFRNCRNAHHFAIVSRLFTFLIARWHFCGPQGPAPCSGDTRTPSSRHACNMESGLKYSFDEL
jgi:hypothetical protein